jgi:hypothetical protein
MKIQDDSNHLEKLKLKAMFGEDTPNSILSKIKVYPFSNKSYARRSLLQSQSHTHSDFFKTQVNGSVSFGTSRKASFNINPNHLFNKTRFADKRQSVLWDKEQKLPQVLADNNNKPMEVSNYRVKSYKVKFEPDWYTRNGIIPKNFKDLAGKDIEIQCNIISDEIKIFTDNMSYYRTHYLHDSRVISI